MRRGLAQSRQQAQEAIAAGRVLVGGAVADKPARLVLPGEPVVVTGPPPRFVSRGGEKLAAALDRFSVDVAGATALDAGASTGGFTDCLLQRGAVLVHAVDVGRGQLHPRLRGDRRVVVHEGTNVRFLNPDIGPVDVVTADLSFISLRTVAPVLAGPLLRRGGDLVVLVKPQFEAGRVEASRGRGVITDRAVWRQAMVGALTAFVAEGTGIMGAMPSPLTGASGNVEFLFHGRSGEPGLPVEELAEAAVAEAGEQVDR